MDRGIFRAAFCAAAVVLAAGQAAAQANGASSQATASITVLDPVTLSQSTAMPTGAAIKPPASGSALTAVPGATYTLSGRGGQTFSVSTPAAITVVRAGGGEELRLQLQPSQTTASLPGAAGSSASTNIAVTATLPLASGAAGGSYVGQYGLTVSYP